MVISQNCVRKQQIYTEAESKANFICFAQKSFFETIDEQRAIVLAQIAEVRIWKNFSLTWTHPNPSARFRMSTGHSHKPLTTPIKQFHCFSSFRLGHIGIHSDMPLGLPLG